MSDVEMYDDFSDVVSSENTVSPQSILDILKTKDPDYLEDIYVKDNIDIIKEIQNISNEVINENDEIKREFMLKKISSEFDIDINILKNNKRNRFKKRFLLFL